MKSARQVFLSCEDDPRGLCFAGVLEMDNDVEVRRAADLGDAFAQACRAEETVTSFPQIKLFISTTFNCNHIEKQLTAGQLWD
jgi:hypothetical protein